MPILQAAFETYKKNPYGYNPHQFNYVEMVNENAKKIANSPKIKHWYETSEFIKKQKKIIKYDISRMD